MNKEISSHKQNCHSFLFLFLIIDDCTHLLPISHMKMYNTNRFWATYFEVLAPLRCSQKSNFDTLYQKNLPHMFFRVIFLVFQLQPKVRKLWNQTALIILQWSIDLGYDVTISQEHQKIAFYSTIHMEQTLRTQNISIQKGKVKEFYEKCQIINFSGFVLRLLKSTGGVDGRALWLLSYERILIRYSLLFWNFTKDAFGLSR